MTSERLVGIALIVLGAMFLLPLVSGIELPLRQWWPLVPMAAGLVSIVNGNWKGGLIVVAVFLLFLLHSLDVLDVDFSSLWPVALIAIGAVLLLGRGRFGAGRASDAAEELKVDSVFSGSNHSVAGEGFRGGNVSATFGSADIDLRSAEVVEGAATIQANAFFGSINLRVPLDWAVDLRSSAVFGSIEAKRPEPVEPRARLVVTGTCWFGEIEITS